MSLQVSLLQYSKLLLEKGFVEEARIIGKVAHYEPVDTPGVPSFFRRNLDYGEGFYFGDMSEKPGVKEWREKHKGKGPNFPVKKKKSATLKPEKAQAIYMEMTGYLHQLQQKAAEWAKKKETALAAGKMREAEAAADAYDQITAIMEDYNKKIDSFVSQYGKEVEKPHAELLEQVDRIINPKAPIDKFRTALFEKRYDEAKELYSKMSPQEREEADVLAKRFYTASTRLKSFCKTASIKEAAVITRENRTYIDRRKGKKVPYQVFYGPHFKAAVEEHRFNMQMLGSALFEDILDKIPNPSPATSKTIYGSEVDRWYLYYNVAWGDGFYCPADMIQVGFITCTEGAADGGYFDSANIGSVCVKLDVSRRGCEEIMEESKRRKQEKEEGKKQQHKQRQQSQKTKQPELEKI